PDWVAPGHKHDRHLRGCGLGRECRRGVADDQSYLPAKKVRHQKRQPVSLIRAVLDRDVLALDEASFRPWRNAATLTDVSGPPERNPTTDIAGCCARAASGHAAAPPSVAKKFRRPM